jgi:hypothetical protein
MDEADDSFPAGWVDPPIETGRYVIKRHNGTTLPVTYDRALQIEMDGDRGYITGSAHTHPGRFHVCFPD